MGIAGKSLREEVGAHPMDVEGVTESVRLYPPSSAPLTSGTMAEKMAPTGNYGPTVEVIVAPEIDLGGAFSTDIEANLMEKFHAITEPTFAVDRDAVREQVKREEQIVMGRRGTFHDNKFASQVKSGGKPLTSTTAFGDFPTADKGTLQ